MPRPAVVLLSFGALLAAVLSPVGARAASFSKEQIFQAATLAARDGDYEKAAELFRKVMEADPRFAPAYNSLGLVYQARGGEGSAAEAMRYFTLAIEIDPGMAEAWNNLGRVYYSSGQFVQAEKALLKSLELRPGQADIELVLAWVYLIGESEAEKANTYFERALNVIDDDMAYYGMGLADIILGDSFKVLDQITELRRRGKEDLAIKLETMVRNKVKITSTPGTPLITGVDMGGSVFDKELQDLAARGFNTGSDGKGIQARLRGPLVY